MARRSHLAYLVTLLLVAVVVGPSLYFGTWVAKVAGCRILQRPGAYLAYCENPAFGSYEHAAYALDLEPAAIAAMLEAKVLFLGNSRLQMGFSTRQTDAFFAERGVPYHLMGFGYGESSRFARKLWQRYGPHPKVVVINADPFFVNAFSQPAYDIDQMPRTMWAEGWMRKVFGVLHPHLCGLPALCTQTTGATYRDERTGQWIWHDVLIPRDTVARAITNTKDQPWPVDKLPEWERIGEAFLTDLGLPRACTILTAVPNPNIASEEIAAALGRRLGVPVVLPSVTGLTASDPSHLSADGAARWSAAFLAEAAPVIDACLAGSRAVAERAP